jgi:hypothetical protein
MGVSSLVHGGVRGGGGGFACGIGGDHDGVLKREGKEARG